MLCISLLGSTQCSSIIAIRFQKMKTLSAGERSVIKATMSALLADRASPKDFQSIQTKFSEILKTNFENRNIWLRFGLTISLSGDSPHSALQAYNECMRIDQDDPLPAMLAAKLSLEHLDDPEQGLGLIEEAIRRCNYLLERRPEVTSATNGDTTSSPSAKKTKSLDDVGRVGGHNIKSTNNNNNSSSNSNNNNNNNSLTPPSHNLANTSPQSSQSSISHRNFHQNQMQLTDKPLVSSNYKDVNPLLSKCYLLASIMHAHIYEREPESIKKLKVEHMKASLKFLDMATETNPNDHLIYFHKALHQVKQRTYPMAIDNLRRAIKLSPDHIPTMQLLILSLSAMKFYNEALLLCESTLYEHENNLLLLYIKCNLEQTLVENKGYKTALDTARYMLGCMRRDASVKDNQNSTTNKTHSSTTTISAAAQSIQQQHHHHNQQQHNHHQQQHQNHHQQANNQQANQSQQQTASGSISNSATGTANNATAATNTTPVHSTGSNQAGDNRQTNILFAEDAAVGCNGDTRTAGKSSFHTDELCIWLLVAEIFVKIGSVEDAEMCVEEGSLHASGALSHQVMYMRGLIAKAKNNLNEAKTFFQSCLALCPRHAKALQQVAHVHYLLGNFSTAEKFLMDSLDLDGDCSKTWHYLSLVFIELNQHDKASECEKKSTALEHSSPVVTFLAIPRLTLQ